MKPARILIPIDTAKCPLEVFDLVNGFANKSEVKVILLHVINLNIVAPENRIYDELGHEAYWHLDRLAHRYVRPSVSTVVRIRSDSPEDEILAEAAKQKVDLILVPNWGPSLWDRLMSFWRRQSGSIVSRGVEKIIREASCAVFVVNAKTRIDCQKVWGRWYRDIEDALQYLRTTPAAKPSAALPVDNLLALKEPTKRLAA